MSGRRSRALKAMNLNRGDRRRAVRASTLTPPKVLAKMFAELDRLDRRRVNRMTRGYGSK